jgi:hypothetical protein
LNPLTNGVARDVSDGGNPIHVVQRGHREDGLMLPRSREECSLQKIGEAGFVR